MCYGSHCTFSGFHTVLTYFCLASSLHWSCFPVTLTLSHTTHRPHRECFPKLGVPDNKLPTTTFVSCSLMFFLCLGTASFFGGRKGIPKCIKCNQASFPLFHLTTLMHMLTAWLDISGLMCCKKRVKLSARETSSLVWSIIVLILVKSSLQSSWES